MSSLSLDQQFNASVERVSKVVDWIESAVAVHKIQAMVRQQLRLKSAGSSNLLFPTIMNLPGHVYFRLTMNNNAG